MKMYRVNGEFLRTQDEAKGACRDAGIKFDADEHQIEVPTDSRGLIDFLNGLYKPTVVAGGVQSLAKWAASVIRHKHDEIVYQAQRELREKAATSAPKKKYAKAS